MLIIRLVRGVGLVGLVILGIRGALVVALISVFKTHEVVNTHDALSSIRRLSAINAAAIDGH